MLARVFTRKTRATPDDDLAFTAPPTLWEMDERITEVHVSCSFTADKPLAEQLAQEWQRLGPWVRVKVGGVAYGDAGGEFVPGRYLKHGYTITSRGCPRRCWFCSVWKRDPTPRTLPIVPGWNVQDDNLLACPRPHVEAVFRMLRVQGCRVQFGGGLEARALEDYQVGLLAGLRPKPNCFFAYDPGDEYETLRSAARRLLSAGFTTRGHRLYCYVLIGYPKDTIALAHERLRQMLLLGFTPFAMLWQPETPAAERWRPSADWKGFQRQWARPTIIHAKRAP